MKAFNPETGQADLDVSFPSGDGVRFWSKVCRDCDGIAGGCFSGPGLPEPSISPYAICPGCGEKNLELRGEPCAD